jgi:hypothetical protein
VPDEAAALAYALMSVSPVSSFIVRPINEMECELPPPQDLAISKVSQGTTGLSALMSERLVGPYCGETGRVILIWFS